MNLIRPAGLFLLLLTGCGGSGVQLANVSGVVRLDGKPLPQATVQFLLVDPNGQPVNRPSIALTDEAGRYTMQYSTDYRGVPPGTYRVMISTFKAEAMDNEDRVIPGVPEMVPENYNAKSELTAEITKQTTLDFDLKSDAGRIVQPNAPGGRPAVR